MKYLDVDHTTILDWVDQAGGLETKTESDGKLGTIWAIENYVAAYQESDTWPASVWPTATNGVQCYSNYVYEYSDNQAYVSVRTNSCNFPDLQLEQCYLKASLNASQTTPDGYGGKVVRQHRLTFFRKAQTVMKLQTGGKAGSGRQSLFQFSATAKKGWLLMAPWWEKPSYYWSFDYGTDTPVSSTNITVRGQQLWEDGTMLEALPNNATVDVPVVVKSEDYCSFTVNVQKSTPYITANTMPLDPDSVTNGADFCVGQRIYFDISGLFSGYLPSDQNDAVVKWTLPGTFVNTNSDPNCDLFYEKDTSFLGRVLSRDKTVSTFCWYVLDAQAATVKVDLNLFFGNGKAHVQLPITGKFNVHRPTVINQNHYPDGNPTPLISANGNFLMLGDNHRHNDMSFQHRINTGEFSGDAGYVQLVGFDGNDFQDQVQTYVANPVLPAIAINLHPVNNLDTLPGGDFPRGTTTIPAFDANNTNSSWTQPFYDGPYVYLDDRSYTTIQHLHFHTYLMFKPQESGSGQSIFVPLQQINWEVKASGQKGNNQLNENNAGITSDSDCTTFPHWSGGVDLNANQPEQ